MADYAFLLDLGRCIGCQACVASCKVGNELGDGQQYIQLIEKTHGEFPNLTGGWDNHRCFHCADADCATDPMCGAEDSDAFCSDDEKKEPHEGRAIVSTYFRDMRDLILETFHSVSARQVQRIETGRADLRLPVDPDLTKAEIVRQDEDDILWRIGGSGRRH